MKARVLKQFIMGNATYRADQEIDLPEDRVLRLMGEGLVEDIRVDVVPPQPSEQAIDPVPAPSEPVVEAPVQEPVKTGKPVKKKKR